MQGATGPRLCHNCGATLAPKELFCNTCHVVEQWMLAVETANLGEVKANLNEENLLLVIQYIQRLKERIRQPRVKPSKRKSPQEFDFALQEIEKTTRGLELNSIEAVGVLEMVKQSFIEEMFYEDYRVEEEEDEGDEE